MPADVFLVVEVSDTALPFDRRVKLPLYAASGVPEVWIVDLGGDAVETHRKPGKSGYAESYRRRRGRKLTIGLLPGWECRVENVIG